MGKVKQEEVQLFAEKVQHFALSRNVPRMIAAHKAPCARHNAESGLSMSEAGVILESTITCPSCGHRATEVMPTDACQFFYDCKGCRIVLKPKTEDCCVFCSYGDVACPPIQESGKSCHRSGCF